jgi:hypothetical protein
MRRFCRTGEHLPAHCMTCSGHGAHHSARRAKARPRLATAERVAGRQPRRRRLQAAAARRAHREVRAAAPARCHQQALATATRWGMQCRLFFRPQSIVLNASSILRCLCRSLRCRSFSILLLPAACASGCCSLAARVRALGAGSLCSPLSFQSPLIVATTLRVLESRQCLYVRVAGRTYVACVVGRCV